MLELQTSINVDVFFQKVIPWRL